MKQRNLTPEELKATEEAAAIKRARKVLQESQEFRLSITAILTEEVQQRAYYGNHYRFKDDSEAVTGYRTYRMSMRHCTVAQAREE